MPNTSRHPVGEFKLKNSEFLRPTLTICAFGPILHF